MGWCAIEVRPDPNQLRVLRLESDDKKYRLQLGGCADLPKGWKPAVLPVQFLGQDPNEEIDCTNRSKACEWRGKRRDLPRHLRQCEQLRCISSSLSKQAPLSTSLTWCSSGSARTDLDLVVIHPCVQAYNITSHSKGCCHCTG